MLPVPWLAKLVSHHNMRWHAAHVADALPRLLAGLHHALRVEAVQQRHRRRLVVAADQVHAAGWVYFSAGPSVGSHMLWHGGQERSF